MLKLLSIIFSLGILTSIGYDICGISSLKQENLELENFYYESTTERIQYQFQSLKESCLRRISIKKKIEKYLTPYPHELTIELIDSYSSDFTSECNHYSGEMTFRESIFSNSAYARLEKSTQKETKLLQFYNLLSDNIPFTYECFSFYFTPRVFVDFKNKVRFGIKSKDYRSTPKVNGNYPSGIGSSNYFIASSDSIILESEFDTILIDADSKYIK